MQFHGGAGKNDGVTLAAPFLAALGPGKERFAGLPDLDQRLADIVGAAKREWPAVSLADQTFVAHLAERLPADEEPAAALAAVCGSDLFLACACAHGVPAAIAELESRYMPRAAATLAKNGSLASQKEELLQLIRMHILLAEHMPRPRIAEYSGRAPLGAWFRVVVSRFIIDYARAHSVPLPPDEPDLLATPTPDPELAYLKVNHGKDLEVAFRETLAALPPRLANVLRLSYIEGVAADAIGAMYKVSGRTVQRWIADARVKILERTQARLGERLRLPESQVDSIIVLVQSQIDASICRFFDKDG